MQQPEIQAIEKPKEQYRGRLLRITTQQMRMPDGRIQPFERAERAPGVRILVTCGQDILLTREWRSETSGWDYRLPGGKVFDSLDDYLSVQAEGDTAIEAATRLAAVKELQEETTLQFPIDAFKPLHRSICGATVVWDLFFYLVEHRLYESQVLQARTTEEGESVHPQWLSHAEVKRLCLGGEIKEDRTVAVLLRFVASAETGHE